MNLIRAYSSWVDRKPYFSQSVTSAVLFGLGDLTCQIVMLNSNHSHPESTSNDSTQQAQVDQKSKYTLFGIDMFRTTRMFVYGGAIGGPLLTVWHRFLARKVAPMMSNKYTRATTLVVLDQSLIAPTFLACYLTYIGLTERKSFPAIEDDLKRKMWPTLVANWKIWPMINFANFLFFPLSLRVLVVNTAGLFWNTYLSYIAFNK